MKNENQYRQLAYLTTILAEVVGTPCGLAYLAYSLSRGTDLQIPLAAIAGLGGFIFGFYRVSKLRKKMEEGS